MTGMELTRRWAQTWKQVGPELEQIRLNEVRDEDNLLSLQLLARAFNPATSTQAPDQSPGIVEMQRHFAKLRRCSLLIDSTPLVSCKTSAITTAGAPVSAAASPSKGGAKPA